MVLTDGLSRMSGRLSCPVLRGGRSGNASSLPDWGGFTTQDIERCQSSARVVALVYNWWSWYCRAAKPEARMEAITSRALLLAAVGRTTKHAGQTTLYLTTMHAARKTLMLLITNIQAALSHIRRVAEQSPAADRWKTLLNYIVARIIPN